MSNYQWVPWLISAISVLIGAISVCVAILTYNRNGKKEDREDIRKEEAKMDGIKESLLKANMKLDTVCATTNETRSDIKSMTKDLIAMDRRVTAMEQKMDTMSEDIEELKGKVHV